MMKHVMARASLSRPSRVRDLLVAAIPGLSDRMLETTIQRGWASIAGPELARRSRPGELRGGTLTVTVDNSPWLHEMTLRSRDLLARLQARHGKAVSALRFSLGALPASAPRSARPAPSRPDRLTAEEARSVDAIAAPVTDPALAVSVRRLLTKDLIARRRRLAPPPAGREQT